MNTHFCKVGNIRPTLNKDLNSMELKNISVDQKTIKTISLGKLSKKTV